MISLTSPIETWAHRWPAGVKLAGLCLATSFLFTQDGLWLHIGALTGTIAVYGLAGRVFLKGGLQRLIGLWPFLAIVLLWSMVVGDFLDGAVVCLRLLSAVALANLVTMTTKLSSMIEVVKWISTPFRRLGLNTRALELGIALVIRFTPTLTEKGRMLNQSWRARSAKRPKWNIVMPLAVLAIDDAERVAEAIKARGGL